VNITYRKICMVLVLGFLDDDNEWNQVTTDSAYYGMPHQMRSTFIIMLVFNEVGDPVGLHSLSLEEHPLSHEHIITLVLVDIKMRLDVKNTDVRAFNLHIPPVRNK
jgi:hypothetical protein